MNFFEVEKSPYNEKYIIRPIHDNLPLGTVYGSCNVIAARIMNLSWPQYLIMCRELYGATLIGKNTKYPVALFETEEKAQKLCSILNKRTSTILKH